MLYYMDEIPRNEHITGVIIGWPLIMLKDNDHCNTKANTKYKKMSSRIKLNGDRIGIKSYNNYGNGTNNCHTKQ